MASLSEPLLFAPFLRPLVWGGRNLASLGKVLPGSENFGESWDISDHPLHRSVVAAGPLAGTTLRRLMETRRSELLGAAAEKHSTFPWLVKFLDARDWLSIQVHPDQDKVQRLLPGEESKTEAWFILDAAPESKVWAGLLPGVDEKTLREALRAGTVEHCLHCFTPRAGEFIFLPAGTVHGVGAGVLFAEIQQTSDATFRLFDWNRTDAMGKPRHLHIEEGLEAIHWERGPVEPIFIKDYLGVKKSPPLLQNLVRCPFFNLAFLRQTQPFAVGGNGRLQAAIVLSGKGCWQDGAAVTRGQAWIIPAAAPTQTLVPEGTMSVFLAHLPG